MAFYFLPRDGGRGRGGGKRQSYEKPGFIGYEGKILLVACSAVDRRLFRSSSQIARGLRREGEGAYL